MNEKQRESECVQNPNDCTRQVLDAEGTAAFSIRFAGAIIHESDSVKKKYWPSHGQTLTVPWSCHPCCVKMHRSASGAEPCEARASALYMLRPIVISLVSILRYCISIYGTCGTTELHRADLLEELKWLNATNLLLYHRICNVRVIVQTSQPSAIACKLERATGHGHVTRNAQRLRLPRILTEAARRQLLYSGVDACNVFCAVYDSRASFNRAVRLYLLPGLRSRRFFFGDSDSDSRLLP